MAKNNEAETPVINLIGNGTMIKGDIQANGDMRIDGTLKGSLNAKGKVVIGTTGNVDGEITCQSADFSGVVKANIVVNDLLIIKSTAQVTGEIKVGKLAIEPGARFTGNCIMTDGGARIQPTATVINEEKIKQPAS